MSSKFAISNLRIRARGLYYNDNIVSRHHKAEVNRIRNRVICRVLHETGLMEEWGSSYQRIVGDCRQGGYPEPEFSETGFFSVVFRPIFNSAGHDEVHDTLESTVQAPHKHLISTPLVGIKWTPCWHQVEILRKCNKDSMLVDLMVITGRSDRTKFRRKVLNPLIEAGLIEMTIPDKSRSSKQRYRITKAGRRVLENTDKESLL